jgi:hypothetical protein
MSTARTAERHVSWFAGRNWLAVGCMSLAASVVAAPITGILGDVVVGGRLNHAATGVAAIDASTGEVGAAAHIVSRQARFRLAVAPGVYHVTASIVSPQGDSVGGLSPLVAVTKGPAHTTVAVSSPMPALSLASVPSATVLPSGAVATMGDVTLQNPEVGGPASLSGPLFTPLFNRTSERCKLRWVDTTKDFVDAHATEVELQHEGRLDPSTPVRDALIMPTVRVEGSFVNDGEQITGELRLVDIASGQVILSRRLTGPTSELRRVIVRWGDEFANAMCPSTKPSKRPPTVTTSTVPTNSTTTTTSSTTSTTMAGGGGGQCTTSSQCGKDECCNHLRGLCCSFVTPTSPNCDGGESPWGTTLGCGYNQNGTTPYSGQPCGPMTPPVCPPAAQEPTDFQCGQCLDDGKYVAAFCTFAPNQTVCRSGD